jgi:DNA-binding SARP family transcriptional activator/pimeloyl-ACP methyl ester carboxylesterase
MARPHLSLLGGFDFVIDAAPAPAFSRKARAMLAYLALQAGHSQSREKLAALLWGSNGEAQARMNLRQALSAIRKQMQTMNGELLVTDGDTVILNIDGFDFDVARFEAQGTGFAREQLEQAAALYRGDLLDGFSLKEEPFEDWLRVERERLRAISIAVLEKLVSHHSAANAPADCIRAATRLLAAEPLREDIHRILMRAYASQGRFNLALKQYERCRTALQQQLRVQPEPQTRELYQGLRARRTGSTETPELPGDSGEQQQVSEIRDAHYPNSGAERPHTHYVKSAGVNIAYQVTGDGPLDMLYVQGWVSNLDHAWGSPRLTHVLRRLGSFCRLIRIDKRGTGLSDRNVGVPTLEERMEDVSAVMSAVGSKQTVLFGSSEGGNMCMLFAATYPERTAALILNGSYARGRWAPDYPWARTSKEVQDDLALIEEQWGGPADLTRGAPTLMNDRYEREWFAAYLRNSASPADAISLWRWGTEIDTRDILHAIHVPTLIVQRTGDRWIRVEEARYLAENIPGAKYVELPGDDHIIWGADSDRLVDVIQDFLVGAAPATPSESILLTVLQMDYVGGATAETGKLLLMRRCQDEITYELQQAEGQAIEFRENGLFAVFQRPTRAIQCAMAIRDRIKGAGLKVRAAIHTGECTKSGDVLTGVAIQLASTLLGRASPGEILVSRTVRDLVVGSGLTFDERDEVELVDVPGTWKFFSVGLPRTPLQ